MQNHAANRYESKLWISELLNLKRWNEASKTDKRYKLITHNSTQPVNLVMLFGTIIEIFQKNDENFKLYSVDDGTGVIVCKHLLTGVMDNIDALGDWDWKNMYKGLQDLSRTNTFVDSSSLCDSVFNDVSVQQEEKDAYQQGRLNALEVLRWSLVNSFRASESIELGDAVCVQGKLYTYFNVNQIYVNAIRPITIQEELSLMLRKLEDYKIRRTRIPGNDEVTDPPSCKVKVNNTSDCLNDAEDGSEVISAYSASKSCSHPFDNSSLSVKTQSQKSVRDVVLPGWDGRGQVLETADDNSHVDLFAPSLLESSALNEEQKNPGSMLSERRVSGLMTFDTMTESQLAVTRTPSRVSRIFSEAVPPSPFCQAGSLFVPPASLCVPSIFDTYFVEELSGSSENDNHSDDEDLFIPATPQAKRSREA